MGLSSISLRRALNEKRMAPRHPLVRDWHFGVQTTTLIPQDVAEMMDLLLFMWPLHPAMTIEFYHRLIINYFHKLPKLKSMICISWLSFCQENFTSPIIMFWVKKWPFVFHEAWKNVQFSAKPVKMYFCRYSQLSLISLNLNLLTLKISFICAGSPAFH